MLEVNKIYTGDALDVLRTFPDESVNCCVTSPPYWSLRDYGTAKWEGGNPECDHKQTVARHDGGRVQIDGFHGSARADSDKGAMNYRDICGKCGAIRIDKQLGLERTPEEYVEKMVEVFREVRRVLRKDGTCWLNLGDCYNNFRVSTNGQSVHKREIRDKPPGRRCVDRKLKEKDLTGIPWRVAFALQADGWWLRSDIIWSKRNPMPSSVTDRPTTSHEYLFLLTKSAKYWYDADAIKEPKITSMDTKSNQTFGAAGGKAEFIYGDRVSGEKWEPSGFRNRRSVWEVSTAPFSGAHFATFPPKLIEPCILAGCPAGGIVIDPFGGAGTTGMVARILNRNYVLIELNPEYADMARKRIDSPVNNDFGCEEEELDQLKLGL